MELQKLLDDLSDDLGIGRFLPDADGVYSLRCADLELTLVPGPDGRDVMFAAEFPGDDADDSGPSRALEANHHRQGGVFVLHDAPDGAAAPLVLERSVSLEGLSCGDFRKILEDFLHQAADWRSLHERQDASSGEPSREDRAEEIPAAPGWIAV